MIKLPLEYGGKKFLLTPYTTSTEKDIMMYNEMTESQDIDGVLRILSDCIEGDVSDLTEREKKAILYKLRSISVGEMIPVKYTCSKCGKPNEGNINIKDIIQPGKEIPGVTDLMVTLTEDNFQDFVSVDLDELDILEYDELFNTVKESLTKFNFVKTTQCQVPSCQAENAFDIEDTKYVLENMSEDTIAGIYQSISDMVFFGKYSKLDIDSMYPYERLIFISLLNKAKEDLST